MNTQDLIQKLEARGITLSLCGKNLHYTAVKPIPAGIVTTIEAHRRVLTKHLKAPKEAEKPTRVDAEPADPKKQFRVIPFWFTSRQVQAGEKTQTRRRLDDYTRSWRAGEIFAAVDEHKEIFAHIKALVIRKQHLGDITEDEAVAEGFKDLAAFRAEWTKRYRKFDEDLEVMVLEFELLSVAEPADPKTATAVAVLTEPAEPDNEFGRPNSFEPLRFQALPVGEFPQQVLTEPTEPDDGLRCRKSFPDLALSFLEAVEAVLVTVKDERPPVLRTPQLKRDLKATEAALSAYRAELLPDDPESRAVGESLANRYRGLN
jgi:uncharacterized protein YhfF